MADRTVRPIQRIHAGDVVLIKSERTSRLEAQEVTAPPCITQRRRW